MDISLRPARIEDLAFARSLYFDTMRWIIERLFGWDQAREEEKFGGFFKLAEVQIIAADGRDVAGFRSNRMVHRSILVRCT